jgi:DeoR/GlpR family transcriptional regulator of sugar metabolism
VLAEEFGVSVDSIRRDLRDFDDRGKKVSAPRRRSPAAGATAASDSIGVRWWVAVARALAGRLQVRRRIVLDNGSTSTLVAQHLTGRNA